MKKITIYEVAKEANVSLATVSRVINGSSVVKEETRKRVEEAINKLEKADGHIKEAIKS